MNNEPTTTPILEVADQPASKGDLYESEKRLQNFVRSEIQETENRFHAVLTDFKDEIINEFKVIAENIHQDVAGANADEITSIKDKQEGQEERIVALEQARS